MVDLGSLGNPSTRAKLIPIIPPSRGHGYDLYKELELISYSFMQDLMTQLKIFQQIQNLHK